MKKLSLFPLLIVAIIASSCNSDDDAPIPNIIGKWQWIAASTNGEPEELHECDPEGFFEYKADGTAIDFSFNSTSINGQITCIDSEIDEYTWSLSQDQLILSNDTGESVTFTILEISATTLRIQYPDTESVDIDTYKRL